MERPGAINEEDSNDESREAAQAIEELQRAQADTLTDDEFEEAAQIGGNSRENQQYAMNIHRTSLPTNYNRRN